METVPPELAARFAAAARAPQFAAAMKHEPRIMTWINFAILIVIVVGATAGIWIVAFTTNDFAEDRGKGASIAGVVTAVLAFAGWWGLREWRTRTTGVPRRVLAAVGDKTEDADLSVGAATRFRICRAVFITSAGEVEDRTVEPAIFDQLRVGEIGVVCLRDDTVLEFRRLAAAPTRTAP